LEDEGANAGFYVSVLPVLTAFLLTSCLSKSIGMN
jgi:hypothetical protein